MKFAYFLLFILFFGKGLLSAQEYNRSSVSLMLLEYNDSSDPVIRQIFSTFTWGDRYDKNELPIKNLTRNTPRPSSSDPSLKSEVLCGLLNRENIGREVIAHLYNRQPSGCMNAEVINRRAAYNKTDREYNIIQATAKKGSGMQEGGEQLIANSYIAVYDYDHIQYVQEKPDKEGNEGDFVWKAKGSLNLFRLVWTDELRTRFYEECWMDEETPEEEQEALRQRFLQFEVPVELVTRLESDFSKNTGIREFRKKSRKEQKGQTEAELRAAAFHELISTGLHSLTSELEKVYEAFHVKSGVYDVKPLRAKIGRKEGVRTDLRFFMYEYALKNGEKQRVRKGVIRATNKISDNRKISDGEATPTEFYQIAGKAAQPGWELEEKKSLGINLQAGYQMGNLTGITAGISGSIYGRKNLNHYLLLDFTYGLDAYKVKWNDAGGNEISEYSMLVTNLGYGYGLMKRNWELYPYIGFGTNILTENTSDNYQDDDVVYVERPQKDKSVSQNNQAQNDGKKENFSDELAWMFNAGIRAAVNVYYPVQVFGALEYSTSIYKGDTYKSLCKHKDIDKATAGIHARFGLRICF